MNETGSSGVGVSAEQAMVLSTSGDGTHVNALVLNQTGPAELWGDLVVKKAEGASNGGNLIVTGTTTLTGALAANGGISTTTLAVTGATTLTGALAANGGITVGNNAGITMGSAGTSTLNMNGNKITNVANGTAIGDAVNFGQLQATRKMLSGGIASTAAMANIPLVDTSKTFAVGVALGGYDGQTAIAVGASYRMSPSTVFRGSVSGGSAAKTAAGAGVSFSW